jgi:hypothetical protein
MDLKEKYYNKEYTDDELKLLTRIEQVHYYIYNWSKFPDDVKNWYTNSLLLGLSTKTDLELYNEVIKIRDAIIIMKKEV